MWDKGKTNIEKILRKPCETFGGNLLNKYYKKYF